MLGQESDVWVPTARLRWVMRTPADAAACSLNALPDKVLQCWHAPEMPGYMRDMRVGEWRDVPMVEGAP
jgi:hypothetical protein